MNKNTRIHIVLNGFLIFLCVLTFVFVIRGLPGNPDMQTFAEHGQEWATDGPLELSPEKGRFALLYSFVEDKSLSFSIPVARFVTPDLGLSDSGKYVSLFAPGVSFLVMPGYLIGKFFNASQVGSFAVVSIFALVNMYLVFRMSRVLGATSYAAKIAALVFGFATPAFVYGTTLYQHHISTFLLLLSMYFLMIRRNLSTYAFIWFACALSVVIDNPNFFLMAPIGIYAFYFFVKDLFARIKTKGRKSHVYQGVTYSILTFMTMVVPIGLFLWYNQAAYGNPFQLPGTLTSVYRVEKDGTATLSNPDDLIGKEENVQTTLSPEESKTVISFFRTRNLYNGFYIHLFSPDRGILYFTPVLFLGLLGLSALYKTNPKAVAFLLAVIGMNILIYSLWGDPWGGWAFGSRYLIPSYALLAVGISIFLSAVNYRAVIYALFFPLFIYSIWVNSLGAVTSSANPPKIQVLSIEKDTGHEQKYTFFRNWEYLHKKYEKVGSKSFIYQGWLQKKITAPQYHFFVFSFILIAIGIATTQEALNESRYKKS